MIKNKRAVSTVSISQIVLTLIIFAFNSTVDASSYKICAESSLTVEPDRHYASDNVSIFIPLIDGKIVSLNKKNLAYLWRVELGGKIISDIFLKSDYVYVVTKVLTNNGMEISAPVGKTVAGKDVLWQIDAKTGLINNKKSLGDNDGYYISGTVGFLTVTETTGKIFLLDEQLSTESEIQAKTPVTGQTLDFNNNLMLTSDDKLFTFDIKNRTTTLILKQSSLIKRVLPFSNSSLLIGDERGNLTLFDEGKNKSIWKFRTGGQITNISIVKNRDILAASADGFVYMLSKSGGLRWKHRLNERINGDIYISGDRVMFGLIGSDSLTILSLKDGRSADGLLIGGEPHFINSLSDDSGQFTVFNSEGIIIYSTGNCL